MTEARALTETALAAGMAEGNPETVEDLRRALSLYRKAGDKRGEALALGWLGQSQNFLGDSGEALRSIRESAALAQETGNHFLFVSTFHWVTLAYASSGEYGKALNALEELSKFAEEMGSKHLIVMIPNHHGWIYNELLNFEKALVHDQRGVDLARRYEDAECEIFSLLNLIGDHLGRGDFEKARACLADVDEKREHKWYRVMKWRYEMHRTRYLSELSLAQGDAGKAMEFAQETLTRGQTTGSKKYIGIGWELKGHALRAMGRLDEATACLEEARELADQMKYPPLRWKTRYAMGEIRKEQGDLDGARADLKGAVSVIDTMASKVSDSEVRTTFLSSEPVQAVYEAIRSLG